MSLAALLNLGKKEKTEDDAPPIPAIEEYLPEVNKDEEPAPSRPSPPSLNLEELKLAQELAQTQSKALEPEFERRKKEEEDEQKKHLDQAAAKAKELAKQAKDNPALFKDGGMYRASFTSSNPFSTGGADFKKGVFVCDTAFGTPKPLGARSTIEMGAQSSDDIRERSRSPVRDPWSVGGCAAFSPAWTGPASSESSSGLPGDGGYGGAYGKGVPACGGFAKGGLEGGCYGKGGYGCGGAYEPWGGCPGGCAWGPPAWGAPAWGAPACGGYGKGACGGYDYGPPGGYGRGPPVGYAPAPGYGAPGATGYGVRQVW